MATVKPFAAIRPRPDLAEKIASRPYDVLNSEEAREEVKGNPYSFLHVTKSEVDLPEGIDIHTEQVYNKAKETLSRFIADGWLVNDSKPCYYVYAQTMWNKTQYGIVGSASVDDYLNNIIKKHELTRPDKEEDRKNHIRVTNCNAEPVFFAYPDHPGIDAIVNEKVKSAPVYDFTLMDGVRHSLWIIDEDAAIFRIEEIFAEEISYTYIADGHHRTASAAHVGEERRAANSNHTGKEEYNYFMAVHFPASQLTIIDYNRVLRDLNELTSTQILEKLSEAFDIVDKGTEIYKPVALHNFSMYLENRWYSLTAKPGTFNDLDPIGVLDVTILSDRVFTPIFNITDLRNSQRIDFVGGIRGLGELKKRVDSGEMKVAFALYPVSMKQIIDIADSGNIMPPKTTWFEPKLRSGLFLHSIE
jgi:uncharacterized protein (DUF1015 family)